MTNAVFDIVKRDLAELEEAMLTVVCSPVELITEIGTHLVQAGGKRLRPALYFLGAHCGKGTSQPVLPLAVALELIHMATLVHDDVIDHATTRRGSATANAKWGGQIAVLSGDYLFAKAFSLVALNSYDGRVMRVLSDIICTMSEGEIVQNQQTFVPSRDEEEYFGRIAKKTADFIAASCELGGIVAGMEKEEIAALREYGYSIGMAFQITDDILDITATSQQIGKPAGNDILQGIVTLPVIRALEVSGRQEELEKIISTRNMGKELLARGLELVHDTDAVAYSYGVVDRYLAQARSVLPNSIPQEARETYHMVADFIAERNF